MNVSSLVKVSLAIALVFLPLQELFALEGSEDYSLPLNNYDEDAIRGQFRPINHTVISTGISSMLIRFAATEGQAVAKGR